MEPALVRGLLSWTSRKVSAPSVTSQRVDLWKEGRILLEMNDSELCDFAQLNIYISTKEMYVQVPIIT